MALPLLFGVNLTFAELGDFMPISTGGHTAPLTPVIFRCVVKVEYARGRVGAPVDITEIRPSQKTGNLVGNQVKSQPFALEMG